jgi:hypothetical protein
MTYGSIGIGNSTAAWSKHLTGVGKSIRSMNPTFQADS